MNEYNLYEELIAESLDNPEIIISKHSQLLNIRREYIQKLKDINSLINSFQFIIENRLKTRENNLSILSQPKKITDELYNEDKKIIQEVAPSINLPVIVVPDETYIPNTKLYYNDKTKLFGIKILGEYIEGEILNILSSGDKIKTPKIGLKPYWRNSEWIYSNSSINRFNAHMRHVGNRDTMYMDILKMNNIERSKRKRQLIHDLLVYLSIIHIR